MQNLKEPVTELNTMLLAGKHMEAFELFYDEDVSMQENNQAPTLGKNANRIREQEFFGQIIDFRGAQLIDVAVGADVSMCVWRYDYTHRTWGVRNYTQVAVQKWRNGKIVSEQFFYGN
jgi:hypothetical protein